MTSLIKTDIFISREISPFSILNDLSQKQCTISGESLLAFKAMDFVFKQSDGWLFFYSSNAIRFFMEGIKNPKKDDLKETLSGIKLAVMGKGSRQTLREFGFEADFMISHDVIASAKTFSTQVKNELVCFVQAEHSLQSIETQLNKDIESSRLVVYSNQVKDSISKQDASILIFTSPLNVQAYFDQYTPTKEQHIIAIGERTKASIIAYGDYQVDIPAAPSEEDIYHLISTKYI